MAAAFAARAAAENADEDLVIIQQTVEGLSEAALAKFLTHARRALRLRATVSVLVTSSREMQGLNHRFRRKNKPTDVLSFPAMPGLMKQFAGDVAISAEIAARNARRLGHTVADEVRILTLHGVLHLAGYDHERDDGQMERKEQRLRKSLGLPAGLIERTGRSVGTTSLASKSKGKPANARGLIRLPVLSSGRSRSNRRKRVSR